MVREAAPSMPDTKLQDLLRAADNEQFDKQEGVNEKFLLDKELSSIASTISAELGPFSLDAYANAQDIISAGALRLLNEGDRTGSFRGENARGGSQWDLQQISVASFEDEENTTLDPASARTYDTGRTGDFNIAPRIDTNADAVDTNPTQADVGSEGDGTHALDADTQAAFVLGMYQSTNPRVVEKALIDVDDGEDRTSSTCTVTVTSVLSRPLRRLRLSTSLTTTPSILMGLLHRMLQQTFTHSELTLTRLPTSTLSRPRSN